jgi:tetratricopeptide (TPR) repeat protein
MNRLLVAALCTLLISGMAAAQENSTPPNAPAPATSTPKDAAAVGSASAQKPDYAKEPFVFEEYATKVRFENDGTGEREYIARIRVQSDAGVQALGELKFGYNSANEQINIQYVRVRKPEGSVVNADPSTVKEITPDIEHDAPVYTDFKEKSVTVPSLQAGATLEYDVQVRITSPLAASEFWYAQNFLTGPIVLDESLEVNLPEGRAVKIASPGAEYATTHDGGRVIYTWKHAQLTHPSADDLKKQAADTSAESPAVEFTTFKSWDDVAQWYAKLEQGRSDPTPEIRAKVAELTQGQTTELDKIQPLYDYVSKNIRYVSLSFGLGRYQPHSAGEVFANKYGDCKDKAILLAAMLRAASISSDVALIPSAAKLDETMPLPSQFDHVITAVPIPGKLVWMDSTTEVAPFRMLLATLRDKSALLVAPDGKGRIVTTPADPPFLASQNVETTATVSDLGKLSGMVRYTVRGDQEVLLRLAFRHTAQKDWKEIGSAILRRDGLSAEATSVEISDPTDTRTPFQVTVHFMQGAFLSWASQQPAVNLPFLSIGLPTASDDNTEPIELGSPLAVDVHLKLTLPADFKPRAPVGINVSRDYADFKSSYAVDGQTLTAERTLNFKMRELPADRTADYLAFTHAVSSDENQQLHLQNISASASKVPQDANVQDVMDAAEAELNNQHQQAAIPLLLRVADLDPKRYEKTVWKDLGLAYESTGQGDKAAAAFRKQLEINPYDQACNLYLGIVLAHEGKFDAATAAYRKQLEINPLDSMALTQLGYVLNSQHKYDESVPVLEKAVALVDDRPYVQVSLGSAYLNTGQKDKGIETLEHAVQIAPLPAIWNDVAYEFAEQKIELDKALQYAQSAVDSSAASLRSVDLAQAKSEQVGWTSSLASYWDTLGWVYFQQGDVSKAARYIRAAWLVDQSGTVGNHLGQILARQGQKDAAADAYAQALAAKRPDPDTRARLILLLGGNEKIDAMVEKAKPELLQQRTFALGKLLDQKADATFAILLSPAGPDGSSAQVDDVRFVSGSDLVRPLGDKIKSINVGAIFPDASPAKLVLDGTLSCTDSGDCSFVLLLPDDDHSLP